MKDLIVFAVGVCFLVVLAFLIGYLTRQKITSKRKFLTAIALSIVVCFVSFFAINLVETDPQYWINPELQWVALMLYYVNFLSGLVIGKKQVVKLH